MKTKINIIAASHETDHVNLNDLNVLAGKYGGTCYAADGYETIKHQPESKAIKRALSNAERGHHSVFQHSIITFEIIFSKMMCILFNSIGVSNASEKSARYTYMKPEEGYVDQLYQKWCSRFQDLIIDYKGEGFFTPSELEKMALDQARYLLSVFTPTSIVYSIPYRNLCYLIEWLQKMADNLASLPQTQFHVRLRNEILSTVEAFQAVFGTEMVISDNKSEFLRVLPFQAAGKELHIAQEWFGDVYQVERTVSFASFAHIIRHRTLTSWANFNGKPGEYGFYIPPILTRPGSEDLKKEWEEDIWSIADVCPQGTMVSFVQQGTFDKFILMCKERLCGRALLETQNVCKDILKGFCHDDLSPFNQEVLDDHLSPYGLPCPRCMFKDFTCTDGCKFGAKGAFKRLI